MAIALVGSPQTFGFADGNAGHVCDLGSAPAVGDFDLLCVNSDTVVTMPSGFSLARNRVANQGAYFWYRKAVGGEGSTVTITTSGNFNAEVSWSRWRGADALDVTALASADASAGSSTPAVSTGALTTTGQLVVAFGAVHGAVPTSPSWSAGFTPLSAVTQGTGASAATGFVAYKTGAGTAAESPQVSWTTPAPDRYILVATFTPIAGTTITLGQAVETNSALAVTRTKVRTVAQAAETDAVPAAATRSKRRTVGQAGEIDSVLPLTALAKRLTAGQAAETDTALPVSVGKRRALGQAVENDNALPAVPAKARTVGPAIETDAALPMSLAKTRSVGQPLEVDTALAVAFHRAVRLGVATETDTALPVLLRKVRTVGQALETDTALPVHVGVFVDLTLTVGPPSRGWSAGSPSRRWSAAPPTL